MIWGTKVFPILCNLVLLPFNEYTMHSLYVCVSMVEIQNSTKHCTVGSDYIRTRVKFSIILKHSGFISISNVKCCLFWTIQYYVWRKRRFESWGLVDYYMATNGNTLCFFSKPTCFLHWGIFGVENKTVSHHAKDERDCIAIACCCR